MKNLLLMLAVVLMATLFMPVGVLAATTVYDNDWSGWNTAVGGSYITENFNDATLNPELTVVTTNGYVDTSNGVWWDRLVYTPGLETTTTWQFAPAIYAFGGTWNPGVPGGPGSNIEVLNLEGSWVSVGVINRSYVNVFWGFVSDVPFTQVRLQAYNGQGWCETYELDDMVYADTIPVSIDIKPGSFPNSINPNAGGVIPVAILTTDDFDASDVNPATVALEGAGARGKGKSGNYGSMEDVDGDGDLDLVVQIQNAVDWDLNATQATLTGMTWGGIPIEGTDSVRIVPPE